MNRTVIIYAVSAVLILTAIALAIQNNKPTPQAQRIGNSPAIASRPAYQGGITANSKPRATAPSSLPHITSATLSSSANGKTVVIRLPYNRRGQVNEMLDFSINVMYATGDSTLFKLVPDDCLETLEINGKPLQLTGNSLAHRCDWKGGFVLDLQPFLTNGANTIRVVVKNNRGMTGLRFRPLTAAELARR